MHLVVTKVKKITTTTTTTTTKTGVATITTNNYCYPTDVAMYSTPCNSPIG